MLVSFLVSPIVLSTSPIVLSTSPIVQQKQTNNKRTNEQQQTNIFWTTLLHYSTCTLLHYATCTLLHYSTCTLLHFSTCTLLFIPLAHS
jgi:hypothetical protein